MRSAHKTGLLLAALILHVVSSAEDELTLLVSLQNFATPSHVQLIYLYQLLRLRFGLKPPCCKAKLLLAYRGPNTWWQVYS